MSQETPPPQLDLSPLPGKQTGRNLPDLVGLMQRLLAQVEVDGEKVTVFERLPPAGEHVQRNAAEVGEELGSIRDRESAQGLGEWIGAEVQAGLPALGVAFVLSNTIAMTASGHY